MKISTIDALQIFDSRGNPTVEARVILQNGTIGTGLVPSGSSTGQFEAIELRDGDTSRFKGRSVYGVIENIRTEISHVLRGKNVMDQEAIDRAMIELDNTSDKSRLGANALLAVSLAAADAASQVKNVRLYEYLGNGAGNLLPLPEIQIIGGGAHADWRTDVQDFLIIPVGAKSYEQALEMAFNVYHTAKESLKAKGKNKGLADEGGFWPQFGTHEEVFDFLIDAILQAGYIPGEDISLSLDISASDLYDGHHYHLKLEGKHYSSGEFAQLMIEWCSKYAILSLEDPMADTDIEGWKIVSNALGNKLQLIGDDLFTTNKSRIREGIKHQIANAVLIKLNQIGTVTETMEAIEITKQAGWNPVISARSGETEDTFISHLAVATNAGQLKVGSFARSERMAKWNEVLRISYHLGESSRFVGSEIFSFR